MKAKISRIITALFELQDIGYFDVFFNYESDLFQVRVYRVYKGKSDLQWPVFQEHINLTIDGERKLEEIFNKLEKIFNIVEALKAVPTRDTNKVEIVPFQCYKQEYVIGKDPDKWIKIPPVIEYADNAIRLTLIDGSGYYIDDRNSGVMYFVDYGIKKPNSINE